MNKAGVSFRKYLDEELKDPEFRAMFEEEKRLLEIGVKIAMERERHGLTQQELAQKSRVTQQQLSKIENGANCNVQTLLRVSSSLGLSVSLA